MTFKPDLSELIHRLAEHFVCQRRKSSPISGQTWRIGVAQTGSAPVTLYFNPTLQSEEDVRDLQNALGCATRSDWRLLVTARGRLPIEDVTVVDLEDLVELDLKTGVLSTVGNLATLAGVPKKKNGGRPSEFGEALKSLIEERIRTGEAFDSANQETRAVTQAFQAKYPLMPTPSESTIKRYIRLF